MLNYFLRRLLLLIPTLLIISVAVFYISTKAPGDPVMERLQQQNSAGDEIENFLNEAAYLQLREQMGLHLPLFYFSIHRASLSDTLYRIPFSQDREMLIALSKQTANWELVDRYYEAVKRLRKLQSKGQLKPEEVRLIADLQSAKDFNEIQQLSSSTNNPLFQPINQLAETAIAKQNFWANYIPSISFYGSQNQYHRWLRHFIGGDWGTSYYDGEAVLPKILKACSWTLILSSISIFIAYLVAIPIGLKSAQHKGSSFDRRLSTLLFALYALPVFWIATLLIFFLGGGDYLDWFPVFGIANLDPNADWMTKLGHYSSYFFLPVLCLSYPSFAFIARQMRQGALSVLSEDYMTTAKAKGLNTSMQLWKHAFRNAAIPMITLFGRAFPALISGSFVVEYIFSIPGMGWLSLSSIQSRDYPVIFAILLLVAFMGILGTFLADMGYAVADPRIAYQKRKA